MKSKEEMLERFKEITKDTKINYFTALLDVIGINPEIINNRECRFEIKSFLEEAFDIDFGNTNSLSDEEAIKIIKNITSLFNIDADGNLNSLQFGQKNTISGGTLISEKIKQLKIQEKQNSDLSGPEKLISQEKLEMKFTKEGNIIEGEIGEMHLEREEIIYAPDQTAVSLEKKNVTVEWDTPQIDYTSIKRMLDQSNKANSIKITCANIKESDKVRITAVRKIRR